MDDRTKLVFHGFLTLNSSQQQDFIDELNKYVRADPNSKRSLKSFNEGEYQRIVSGPISSGCACCGR